MTQQTPETPESPDIIDVTGEDEEQALQSDVPSIVVPDPSDEFEEFDQAEENTRRLEREGDVEAEDDLVEQFRRRMEGLPLAGVDDSSPRPMAAEDVPINVNNQLVQPVPTQVKCGVLDSTQGPVAALSFLHPAGEYTFMTQEPDEIDMLVSQLTQLREDLKQKVARHRLQTPGANGLVIPTPNVPGANGARLL